MFCNAIAWGFWKNRRNVLSRLVVALMVVMAAGYLRDTVFLACFSTIPDLWLELATISDIVAIPLYACILYELCCPGRITLQKVILSELPFVVLPVMLAVTRCRVFYFIDMGLGISLGLSMAIWTFFAIPAYHRHLKAAFSYDENVNLRWLQSILWGFFVLFMVWGVSCIVYNPWFEVAYMVSSLLIWIFICYSIYRHKSAVDELQPVIVADKAGANAAPDQRSEVFARIKKLIEEDHIYLNPLLKLSDIARLAHTNRTYASLYFKNEAGATFYDYINGLRLKYAMEQLKHTSMRLDEVSEKSGFNSLRSFHRVFVAVRGLTPNEYRQNARRAE